MNWRFDSKGDSNLILTTVAVFTIVGSLLCACGNKLPDHLSESEPEADPSSAKPEAQKGQKVSPPFDVRDDLNGLLLVWFDKDGLHTADKRSQVPEARREYVRVDSLLIAPEKRLDPDYVYIADLRKPTADGSYEVRKYRRDWFEELVDHEAGVAKSDKPSSPTDSNRSDKPKDATAPVIIYGAPWCVACRVAAQYLRKNGIAVVEKDIEKDSSAYAEMQQKARAAGVQPGGLPLIDFRGHIVSGFNPDVLNQLRK
jgi:glutaredoxin